jgi:hypothetical protein
MKGSALLFFSLALPFFLQAQTEVSGKVTDARTGEAVPFVSVYFKGTSVGTTTNFDGFYTLKTTGQADSIAASYIGYETAAKKVVPGVRQTIHFQLEEAANFLPEAIVRPGVNPAIRIIKAAQNRRSVNDYEKLDAIQYESYTKIQLAVDQLTEKQNKSRLMKSVVPLFDTIAQLSDGSLTPVLPVFISETLSDFYITRNPFRQKEIIKATQMLGVGLEDQNSTAQILGSSFQQYNFHTNWVRILDKDFISPVGNASLDFYIYTLRDSMEIDGIKCYQIDCNPKRPSDLAFTGTMWVADSSFAIRRLQFYMDKRANLNFLDQFKIQQEYESTAAGAWVPVKTRVLINLDEPSKKTPGLVALFYISNKNVITNQPKDPKFYTGDLVIEEEALDKKEDFWEENRHEEQTEGDKRIAYMIDTLNNLPVIRTWVEWMNILVSGYKKAGKIDVGPYALLYGYNLLEGHRFRIGLRTNYQFSTKFTVRGYVAYGTRDKRWKYGGQAEWYADKRNWTVLGLKYKNDVEQIGITDQNYNQSNAFTTIALFQASRMNRAVEKTFFASRQWLPSWSSKLAFQLKDYAFEPIRNKFNFAYYDPYLPPSENTISSRFSTSTLSLELRYAYKEQFLLNYNERYSFGPQKGPAVSVGYDLGLKEVLGGGFDFHKIKLTVNQNIRMGRFGEGNYIFTAGKVIGRLPYPVLYVQRGNASVISSRSTYNLMNLFEFVADQYIAMNYEHHFGGSLFNRIPLVKRLKLRFLFTAKGVWGSIDDRNLSLLPAEDQHGRGVTQFYKLNREPYAEISYGIENIFSFGRVDFIHRMTHLGNPGAIPFGIKFSAQFSF